MLARHLLRSHSRDLLLAPVSSLGGLALYLTTAGGSLIKDTVLDTVLVPSLDGPPPALAVDAPGMDLVAWEQELDRITGRPATEGSVEILVDGKAFFERLDAEIEVAQSSIRFRTYIFDNDDVAVAVADRLKRRAEEIPVEVLVDGIGTWGGALIESPTLPADHLGPVSVVDYLRADSRVAVRAVGNPWLTGDHTKSFVFDDSVALLGGMNIGREYRHDWHDLMVALKGPVVTQLATDAKRASARQRWGDFSLLADIDVAAVPAGSAPVSVRLLYTRPYDAEIYRAQLAAIRGARQHIFIENAYLGDDLILYELIRARRRGVDVRVVVPNRPDSELMNRSNAVAVNTLTEHGVRVYLYPGMTHVKAAIYDGWVCLGTANFDRLSFRVNREVNIATSAPEVVAAVRREIFERDFQVSAELTRAQPVQFADYLYERIVDVAL